MAVRLRCRLTRRRREQRCCLVDDDALGDGHAFPSSAPAAGAAAVQPGAVVPRVRFRSLGLMDPLLCNAETAREIESLRNGLLLLLSSLR